MKSQMRKALGRARWGRPVDGVLEGCRDCIGGESGEVSF